jgi:hypothetical protein
VTLVRMKAPKATSSHSRENVVKIIGLLRATAITSFLLLSLVGCDSQKGPAETAGESVDNAVQKMGEKVEEAGDAVKDATN